MRDTIFSGATAALESFGSATAAVRRAAETTTGRVVVVEVDENSWWMLPVGDLYLFIRCALPWLVGTSAFDAWPTVIPSFRHELAGFVWAPVTMGFVAMASLKACEAISDTGIPAA